MGVAVTAALALRQATGPRAVVFSGLHVVDMYSAFFKLVFLVSAAIVILLSIRFLQDQQVPEGEFYALLLFATLGAMLMASAYDLLSLFVGLETLSISTYALCGFLKKDQRCNEGALKYLLMGAFSTGVLLYGMVLLYGFAGGTGLDAIARAAAMAGPRNPALLMAMVLLAAGFGFKIAAVPFHMYLPDMYEGAPTPVVAYMAGAAELAGMAVILRVFLLAMPTLQAEWSLLFWVLAVLTMTIGNLVAIAQANLKRMLAYSTIAHMGYLLIGPVVGSQLGVAAVLFYSLTYALMTIGAFGMVILLQRGTVRGDQIDDFTGLAQKSPLSAAVMLLFLLSLTGIPPTAGFVGKSLPVRRRGRGGIHLVGPDRRRQLRHLPLLLHAGGRGDVHAGSAATGPGPEHLLHASGRPVARRGRNASPRHLPGAHPGVRPGLRGRDRRLATCRPVRLTSRLQAGSAG